VTRVGHAPRSGPEVKDGRSGAEDGAPERLGCGTVKEEVSQILQRVSAGAACCMKNSPSVLSCIGKRTREGCDRGSEVKTVQRLNQRLAASTWRCGPHRSILEVGRNGETTTLRGPTIRSPPNRQEC